MQTDYVELFYVDEIKDFWKDVVAYCEDKKIPITFKNFITHESTGWGNKNYKFLIDGPKYLFVASKSFKKFYDGLDKDFQDDMITSAEFRQFKIDLKTRFVLQHLLEDLLKEDYIGLQDDFKKHGQIAVSHSKRK